MVCSLLDMSIGEENSESQKNYTVLEFSDNRGDEVVFKIQEISRFRTLEHLSIKLRKGNDAKVREYLGECYRQLKSEHTNKLKEIHELTTLLQDYKSQNDSLQIQVETQRRECSQRIEEERNPAAHEISQTHSEYCNKLEKEQKEFSEVFNTDENKCTQKFCSWFLKLTLLIILAGIFTYCEEQIFRLILGYIMDADYLENWMPPPELLLGTFSEIRILEFLI